MPELHIRARIARLLGSAPMRRLYWSLLRLLPVLRIGDRILVARHLEVRSVLRRHHEFSVRKYGSRMRIAGGDFLLGHDEDALRSELEPIALEAMARSRPERVFELSRDYTRQAIARRRQTEGQIDVIRDLVDEVPVRIVEDFFGLTNPGGRTLLEWNQLIAWWIFNPFAGPADRERARRAGQLLREQIAALVAERAGSRTPPQTVLGWLVRILIDKHIKDPEEKAVWTLAGLVAGTLGPGPQMLGTSIDRLLGLRWRKWRRLCDAAKGEDFASLEAHLLEGGRMEPTPGVLYRACEQDTTLLGRPIEAGRTVLCIVESALRDRREIRAPNRFRPERWRPGKGDPMIFGEGLHWCLGRDIGMDILVGIAQPLFELPGLRRARGRRGRLRAGDFERFPEQNFAQHLWVRFDS